MSTMNLGMITFDTTDAVSLAAWWARHTGGEVQDPSGGWFVMVAAEGRPTLAFQKIDDPTPGKNRLHLDRHVADRVATAAELVADGATLVAERAEHGFTWTVLADPDGNQFCLAQEDGA
jgi:predicted enzyme related to lactoylglutathione lyase